MTTTAAVAPVSRAAVAATRRRAVPAGVMFRSSTAAMRRGDPAAETCRSSTTAMEGAGLAAAKFRSRNIAIARATGRGQSAAARSDRVPATRGIGRDLRRGRLVSASATALCWAIRHRIGLAGCLVVLRMMRPPAATRTLCAGTIRCSNMAGDAGAVARGERTLMPDERMLALCPVRGTWEPVPRSALVEQRPAGRSPTLGTLRRNNPR